MREKEGLSPPYFFSFGIDAHKVNLHYPSFRATLSYLAMQNKTKFYSISPQMADHSTFDSEKLQTIPCMSVLLNPSPLLPESEI